MKQFYQSRVIDEFVLKGNTGILKCLVPSFVTDFVQVDAWVADDGIVYEYDPNLPQVQGNCQSEREKQHPPPNSAPNIARY